MGCFYQGDRVWKEGRCNLRAGGRGIGTLISLERYGEIMAFQGNAGVKPRTSKLPWDSPAEEPSDQRAKGIVVVQGGATGEPSTVERLLTGSKKQKSGDKFSIY